MAYLQTLQNMPKLGTWRASRKKAHKRFIVASLMLTPMVDMFSLLVIFLLQFFSTAPEFQITPNINLPPSISSMKNDLAIVVSVSKDEVFVDHEKIGPLEDVLKNPGPLSDALLKAREKWAADHPQQTFTGEVNLEADQEVKSTTVSHVMAILNGHHFGAVNLLTLGGES